MAATPFETALTNSSFVFDIYNDASPARNAPVLPAGPCNFVDITHGPHGARCGCRRFWSRLGPGNVAGADQAGWCMCSHHACYHDDAPGAHGQGASASLPASAPAPAPTALTAPAATTAGQENERPRGNREPLSPVQDLASFQMPSNLGMSLDFPGLNLDHASLGDIIPEVANSAREPVHAPAQQAQQDSSIPDTLSWGNYVPSQNGPTTLPPIPSQCLMPPSQPPSTSSSSHARYLRPFAGKGLQTLTGTNLRQSLGDPGAIDERDEGAAGGTYGADHPPLSIGPLAVVPYAAETPRAHETPEGSVRYDSSTTLPDTNRDTLRQLSDTVQSHEQRLDRLENPSMSVLGHDECQEKHDHTDMRITELESRVEEVEKKLNDDNSTAGSSRRLLRDDDATVSVVSVATDATARASGSSELYSQLQALQAQVNSLQTSSLPSYNNPWELEVVFLPFPLKGIWMEAGEFSAQRQPGIRSSLGDEWTQLPSTLSRQTPDPQSPDLTGWAGSGPVSGWLLPRACAPGRLIEGRLKSRGLIKTLTVRGSDARSIQLAMSDAFGTVLRTMPGRTDSAVYRRSSSYSHMADMRVAKFLGLQQAWVPLRKIHKDSRLRFLAPAEMLTPTLWDVAFLRSSVTMRATGMHRLYVTQPDAYLQDGRAFESGWSWQRLRELSRIYPDSQSSGSSQEGLEGADGAAEHCWAWNSRLDEPPTASPSALSLRQAAQNPNRSHSSGSSQQFFTVAQSPILSTSPAALRAQSPLVMKDRKGSKPPYLRTGSVPPAAIPAAFSPAGLGKRRVTTSYANAVANSTTYERRPSPFLVPNRSSPRPVMASSPTIGAAILKRRSTRSPSLRPRTTPRWSTSRSPSVGPFVAHGGMDDRARGTTPFCYATPYSNAPHEFLPRQGSRGPAPVPVRTGGYDDDDGDDMDCGSDTDPYDEDSQMTHDADDELVGIEVYEDDEADNLDDVPANSRGANESRVRGTRLQPGRAGPQLPEDEPWPGIEDNMSDDENMDPLSAEDVDIEIDGDDVRSDISSQPSEYPSTQRAWHITESGGRKQANGDDSNGDDSEGDEEGDDDGIGFKIHEDGDAAADGGLMTQHP